MVRGTGINQAKIVITCTRTITSSLSSECYLCQNHALTEVRNTFCLLYQQLNQGSTFHKAYDVSPSSPPHVRKELAISSYTNAYMPCQHPSHVIEDVTTIASTIGPNHLKFPGNCRLRKHTQHSTFRSRPVSTSNDAQPHSNLHTLSNRHPSSNEPSTTQSHTQLHSPKYFTQHAARALPSLLAKCWTYLRQHTNKLTAIYIYRFHGTGTSISVIVHFPSWCSCEAI